MFRCWIIRGFFIGLLALCASGWVCSGFYGGIVGFGRASRGGIGVATYAGVLVFALEKAEGATSDGWHNFFGPMPQPEFWPSGNLLPYRYFLGFGYYDSNTIRAVAVPYWLLIVISSVGLRLAWRKTRPKPDPKTAFPVEATSTTDHRTTNPTTDH